ncbi:hypothetical protein BDB00DRAFT_500045 [Zychaea mexicana]|uniref:uncharacterized protein n=1 Tax=Zychaea mexicana TaxID=64656 RepID=UPI0022FEBD0B|nr:uncharacterized protein BDB00DRAFT_500045 [Zychaea mexicana]KAI9498133.1 hypothetical protein BDB00DRAFT_500045 [Zychaea mexicana]
MCSFFFSSRRNVPIDETSRLTFDVDQNVSCVNGLKILPDLTHNSPAIFVSDASDKTDQLMSTNSSSSSSRSSSTNNNNNNSREHASTTCITGPPPTDKIIVQPSSTPSRFFDSSFASSTATTATTAISPTLTSNTAALPPPFPDYNDHDGKNDDELGSMHTRSFSSLLSTDAEPPSLGGFTPMNNSSRFMRAIRMAKKKRRGSIGEGTLRRQKAISVPVEPRLTKSSTQTQQRYDSITSRLQEQVVDKEQHRMWDPHIDAFEILRAKITGITRTMQEFHVQELFQDELSERRERRMSTSIDHQNKKSSLLGHRRIRSHGSVEFMLHHKQRKANDSQANDEDDADENDDENEALNSPPPPPPAPTVDQLQRHGEQKEDVWSHLRTDDDFAEDMLLNSNNNYVQGNEEEEEDDALFDHNANHGLAPPTSPNLTALFLTTNSLINSRLDELSETASIASSCDLANSSSAEWRSQFLELVSSCITQSEGLESLSTELLGTEGRVRELLVAEQTVQEQYREREKAYEERIRECQEVAKQQLLMIDTLEELTADLEMKMEQLNSQQQELEQQPDEDDDGDAYSAADERSSVNNESWNFRRAIADILGIESKDDLVHRMRWEVGMFVGGGVGTGHIIHTFEGRLRGIEMMIAGSGTTTVDEYHHQSTAYQQSSTYQSHSIRHTQFHHHHYLLHLRPEDRKTRFRLIPRAHWVPDQLADQCQFERSENRRCPTQFTLFQRKHHCRRCGKIICQRHSSNRLPLFATPSAPAQWSRVCDQCFCSLIIIVE